MVFLRPLWFLALLPLAWLLWWLWRRRASASVWSGVVDPHLLPHLLVGEAVGARRWPWGLLGAGWVMLVVALAGPVWRQLPQPVFSLDARCVILLDLSPSLEATDVPPSRLTRARFETLDLLRALREGQVGLIAFGSEPFLVAPLSADANTIAAQVPLLASDLIPAPGARRTDRALDMAAGMLERAGGGAGQVILITDAVGEMGGSLEAARRLAAAGHRLSVLAVGTPQGAPVPRRGGGFEQDAAGALQIAHLEHERLRDLARAGNGRYQEATVGDADTRALIAAMPRSDAASEVSALTADRWREDGPWLLLCLLPLAALAFRRGWLLALLLGVSVLHTDQALAFDWADLWWRADQQGARELAAGHPGAAAEHFTDPAWRAAASYRAGDFTRALESLAGLTGATADYNRGNALARLGRLGEAADAYERALQQAPDHADARHNLELVRRLQASSRDQPEAPGHQPTRNPPSEQDSGSDASGDPHGADPSPASASASDVGEAGQPAAAAAPSDPDHAAESSQTARRPQRSDAPTAEAEPQANTPAAPVQPDVRDLAAGERSPEEREREQALDARLRQVPDDPAGLLRQRFLLQHLRREGQLP